MSQAYSDPSRESDPHALPDIEVFYDDADVMNGHARNYNGNGEPVKAGWYWWPCFPGCLPDGEPMGPFATRAEALADAQSQNEPAEERIYTDYHDSANAAD